MGLDEPVQLLVHDNSQRNIGLSKAVNRLLEQSTGDLILFCNPDVEFNETLSHLIRFVRQNPLVGAVPEFLNNDGSVQRIINKRYPTVARIVMDFTAFGRLYLSRVFPTIRNDFGYIGRDFQQPTRIEQPGGSFLLMSRQAVKKLAFFYDQQFPVLWNDVDMAIRAKSLGIQFALVPSAKIVHALGHSTRSVNQSRLSMLFYSSAGMIGFARKWRMHPRILQSMIFFDAVFIIASAPLRMLYREARPRDMGERTLRTRLRNIQVGVLRYRASLS